MTEVLIGPGGWVEIEGKRAVNTGSEPIPIGFLYAELAGGSYTVGGVTYSTLSVHIDDLHIEQQAGPVE